MGRRLETILHRAALRKRKEMVEFLVKKGAAQEHDVNGNTPLHCAALGGDPQVADYLYDDDCVEFGLLTVRMGDFYSKIETR